MRRAVLRRPFWLLPVLVACAAPQPAASRAEVIAVPPPTTTEPAQEDAAPSPTGDASSRGSVFGPFEQLSKARVETARVSALAIGSAVELWQAQGGGSCPRYDELVRDQVLPPDSDNRDPWGKPYRIECSGTGVIVTSNGPDREPGTADDVASASP